MTRQIRFWGAVASAALLLILAGCPQPSPGKAVRADQLFGGEREPASVDVEIECFEDAQCDDGLAFTRDSCNEAGQCLHQEITDCKSGDGYCPLGCSRETDTDCLAPPACETDLDCDDAKAETEDACEGTPRGCVHRLITACRSGDGYCPAGCNLAVDADCSSLPPDAVACQTDSDCDDGDLRTADSCSGEPPTCSHFLVKNCVHNDGVCPERCSPDNDADCRDKCTENRDCIDGKEETLDRCTGTPRRCKNTVITDCAPGDGFCPATCIEATDSDCGCTNDDGVCPKQCDFRNDTDCPKADLCFKDVMCDDGKDYTLDACTGTPRVCEHYFVDGSACGEIDTAGNVPLAAAECWCRGYFECRKAGLIVHGGDENRLTFSILDLKNGNCHLEFNPIHFEGVDLDARINYRTTCFELDSGAPALAGPLRSSLKTGEQCVGLVQKFFSEFPATMLNQAANCRGGFVEYYAERHPLPPSG